MMTNTRNQSSDKTDLKGTSDLELGRTLRRLCSPRPVAAPVKRKLDVSDNTRISEELVEADTQTNVAKERKMVKIVRKYVEEGRQVEKIEEHETIWIV